MTPPPRTGQKNDETPTAVGVSILGRVGIVVLIVAIIALAIIGFAIEGADG
jgi:hypothetical protein